MSSRFVRRTGGSPSTNLPFCLWKGCTADRNPLAGLSMSKHLEEELVDWQRRQYAIKNQLPGCYNCVPGIPKTNPHRPIRYNCTRSYVWICRYVFINYRIRIYRQICHISSIVTSVIKMFCTSISRPMLKSLMHWVCVRGRCAKNNHSLLNQSLNQWQQYKCPSPLHHTWKNQPNPQDLSPWPHASVNRFDASKDHAQMSSVWNLRTKWRWITEDGVEMNH